MPPLIDPAASPPESERRFRGLLEDHYAEQGFDPRAPLTQHWIDAMGFGTYRAGGVAAREMADLLRLAGSKSLDVGCGFGGGLLHMTLQGARAVGLEYDPVRLRLARKRLGFHGIGGASMLAADGFRMPFADGTFDIVFSTDVLEHIRERKAMLSEMARVLRRGGLMYLAFPNLLSVRNAWRDPHYHLFGATLLPQRWADAYTRRVRGHAYECEVLPIARGLASHCRALGVNLYSVRTSERVLLQRIDEPTSIRGRSRPAFILAKRLGLAPLLRELVRVRATLCDQAVLAGFKA